MGAVISDLFEETRDLATITAQFPSPPTKRNAHHGPIHTVQEAIVAESQWRTRKKGRRRAAAAQGSRVRATRRLNGFAERLERLYELDPKMVQRSSTPTDRLWSPSGAGDGDIEEEEENSAWTSYLRTPGTFHGQMKPNLPGAFSGQCFPRTDPRWICHHPNVPSAVKSIVIN